MHDSPLTLLCLHQTVGSAAGKDAGAKIATAYEGMLRAEADRVRQVSQSFSLPATCLGSLADACFSRFPDMVSPGSLRCSCVLGCVFMRLLWNLVSNSGGPRGR
jgi:hypothetical protein